MGSHSIFINCQFNIQKNYIMLKGCFSFLLLATFAITLSSSFLTKRQTNEISNQCAGAECQKCQDFGGESEFNCLQSCSLCPLCQIFFIKPGCDYCTEGVQACEENCIRGRQICKKWEEEGCC